MTSPLKLISQIDHEFGVTSHFCGNGCEHGFKPALDCPNPECKTKQQHIAWNALKLGKRPKLSSLGLKDHEINILSSNLRDRISLFAPHQCLREVIQGVIMDTLTKMDKRIDEPLWDKVKRKVDGVLNTELK